MSDTKLNQCAKLEVGETINDMGSSKYDQLMLKCVQNTLPVTGSKYELALCLIHYQYGTVPNNVATPADTAPSADVPSDAAAVKSTAMTPNHRASEEVELLD